MHIVSVKTKPDKELILGCIKENRSCQKELYYRYAGKMFTVCKRYAHNDVEAEDFLQESFMKVFDNIKYFKNQGSFEGWIRRIVINNAIRHCRKIRFNNEKIGIEEYYELQEQPTVISDLSAQDLLNIIHELPVGYQTVFNMYAIDGFSHKEIADELQINESTSRSQLAKARKMLQGKLKKQSKEAV